MVQRQSNSTSRSMGISARGRKMVKDMHDLFSTLIVSLDLRDHRQFFKSYAFSFTTDEACLNLSALKFAQSNRTPDPKNPRRVAVTTTTTTFLMSRESAKATCQEFLDARLIANAVEPAGTDFRERGIWRCTPKGLAVLERFVKINGISGPELIRLLGAPEHQDRPPVIHLERHPETDRLHLSRQTVAALWKRFAGGRPNVIASVGAPAAPENDSPAGRLPPVQPSVNTSTGALVKRASSTIARSSISLGIDGQQAAHLHRGIAVRKFAIRSKVASGGPAIEQIFDHCMPALAILDWLLEHSSVALRIEAAEVAAQFVRWGFIAMAQDKSRSSRDMALVTTFSDTDESGKLIEGEYRGAERAVYRVTDTGACAAGWDLLADETGDDFSPYLSTSSAGRGIARRHSNSHSARVSEVDQFADPEATASPAKDSGGLRLQHILSDPGLRTLFEDFLRSRFCVENLAFVLEVQEFRKRFATSSSAAAAPASRYVKECGGEMDYHTQELIERAFWIYNRYLAPLSPSELNVDHTARIDVTSYVQTHLASAAALAKRRHEQRLPFQGGPTMTAGQLQTMLVLFERVQAHTYRLMATDSVPKFAKTAAYTAYVRGRPSAASVAEDD